MKLIYGIKDKPGFGKTALFSFQHLLTIMAATIAVPAVVGNGLSASAALFGAGLGTIIYLLFTKSASPVFLGSNFAFIGSMFSAFAGAATIGITEQAGYWGLIIGAVMASLVYVILSVIVKLCGVNWINKIMPPVIVGSTVATIGLILSGNAVVNLMRSNVLGGSDHISLICGLFTMTVTMLCATYGRHFGKMVPFLIGIFAGYVLASIFAFIGYKTGNEIFTVIDYSAFEELNFKSISGYFTLPKFTFLLGGKEGFKAITGKYILILFTSYVPVAFVAFSEHLADHQNLSSIVEKDLLKEPGLSRTLLGDGFGSMASTFFGGCPNTTYSESIGCIAITRNASTISIWGCAILCMLFSFLSPFIAFLETIPACVIGGICIPLYGYFSLSGIKMLQKVDFNRNCNIFTASVILITGVGGMVINFGTIEITSLACALILGILTNLMLSKESDEKIER